jgi:hypothetical protein
VTWRVGHVVPVTVPVVRPGVRCGGGAKVGGSSLVPMKVRCRSGMTERGRAPDKREDGISTHQAHLVDAEMVGSMPSTSHFVKCTWSSLSASSGNASSLRHEGFVYPLLYPLDVQKSVERAPRVTG